MATNTAALKTFAQQTRLKLLSLIKTKLEFILTQDTAELRGYETQIANLKTQIQAKGKDIVVEEVAYTWFNRVMALRYMDANDYSTPKVVTPAMGQMRPEILQEAMSGSVDENLRISPEDLNLPEAKLYRKLLVATCNHWGSAMPFLFEHISDYTELLLPEDLLSEQSFVSDIRKGMTDEDCQNVEIMGWLYQFYITDRKADAEVKKTKKGGLKSDEQAAATQLFTPHWVVRYMVENSLGRTWMTLHPDSRLVEEMPYYIPTPEGQTDTIPEDIHSATDIKFIDPCMGSGHVLVYAFDLFCKMYEEEGYQTREIPSLILTNNIYGIDIDLRCKQLASFALTMKARAYHSRYLRRAVMPNTIALEAIEHDVIASTGAWSNKSTMWQFENVDTIGSLLQIDPKECAKIQVESGLFGTRQQLLKTQAEYLSQKYHCVVTNPPYLGKGFCDVLKNYVNATYPNSKSDLYAAFIECLSDKVVANGYTGLVTMESWMFLSSYENLRKYLIDHKTIISLSHFDWHIMRIAFGTVAFVLQNKKHNGYKGVYSYLDRTDVDLQVELPYVFPRKDNGRYAIKNQSNFEKIPGSPIGYWASDNALDSFSRGVIINDISTPRQGMATSDVNRFIKLWHEVSLNKIGFNKSNRLEAKASNCKWFPHNKGGGIRKWFGNNIFIVNWENDGEEVLGFAKQLYGSPTRTIKNIDYYFQPSITWGMIGSGLLSIRISSKGFLFDVGGPSAFKKEIDLSIIAGFLNSKVAFHFIKLINPTLNYNSGDIGRLPFIKNEILDKTEHIRPLVDNCTNTSKLDWDAHETSWDFQCNPLLERMNDCGQNVADLDMLDEEDRAEILASIHVPTNAHLLTDVVEAYKHHWEKKFKQLHANEEELNRRFIEIYGLQDELTPDVPLDEVTILQKGEIDIVDGEIVWNEGIVIKQLISYLVGCFMGRYSIDKPGLIIASLHQDLSALGVKVEGVENGAEGRLEIDDDGVVPILAGEYFPDDMTVRIEQAIKLIFGEEHFNDNLRYIDEKLGKPLREYLYKDFFNDHIDGKMYQKRPIYWMFSSKMGDKRKKGYFKALVYMHRMESDTLSKLHADYVVPYIDKIEQQHIEAEDLSLRDDISQAQRNKARKSAEEYADQIRELKDFEQVLVQMASQRLSIDLDDGVRVNYPKFYPLVEPIKGLDKE